MNLSITQTAAEHLQRDLDGAIIQYDADEDGYLLDHPDAVSAVWCG